MKMTSRTDFIKVPRTLSEAETAEWVAKLHEDMDRADLKIMGDRPFIGVYDHSIEGAIPASADRSLTEVRRIRGMGYGG